jgi:hypothetical protein
VLSKSTPDAAKTRLRDETKAWTSSLEKKRTLLTRIIDEAAFSH